MVLATPVNTRATALEVLVVMRLDDLALVVVEGFRQVPPTLELVNEEVGQPMTGNRLR